MLGRDLEQEYRDRLTALRSQSEQETESLLQQVEQERRVLQDELQLHQAQETWLQEELCGATQVCSRRRPARLLCYDSEYSPRCGTVEPVWRLETRWSHLGGDVLHNMWAWALLLLTSYKKSVCNVVLMKSDQLFDHQTEQANHSPSLNDQVFRGKKAC